MCRNCCQALDSPPLSLQLVFDYRPGDVFGCVAGYQLDHGDTEGGQMGPLCNGATRPFESTPVYPMRVRAAVSRKEEQRLRVWGKWV